MIGGLLSPHMMGAPQQMMPRPPQANAMQQPGRPVAQAPGAGTMQSIGDRFLQFAQSNPGALGALGASLMAGQPAQGMAAMSQITAEGKKKNQTLEFLRKNNPEIAGMVEAGMPVSDAFQLFVAQRKAQKPTSAMQNFEYLVSQGMDRETALRQAFSSGTTVNVGGDGAPGLGKLSSDYGYVLDPNTRQPVIDPATGLPQAAPVPGSPAALEQQAAQNSGESKEEQQRTWNLIVKDEIGRALAIVDGNNWLPATGIGSEQAAKVGGSNARDLRGLLDTIKANAGFDRLQAMRDSSTTGASGLGQVTERELAFVQATIGNLEQSQSTEQLKYNLKRMQKIYENMLAGRRAYDGLLDDGTGNDDEWMDMGNGVRLRKL